MPVHDWTKVDAGLFHHFHQRWIGALCDGLNNGCLPKDFFALVEQNIHGPIPKSGEADSYLAKTDRITLRHRHGKVVAVIEIVSPGNKASRTAFRTMIEKSADVVYQGIHLLVIDLFPPTPRDPLGIANSIWGELTNDTLEQFPEKPLTLLSIDAGFERTIYVEPIAVGDVLPDMPLFFRPEQYVLAPLESTYQAMWAVLPEPMKRLLT